MSYSLTLERVYGSVRLSTLKRIVSRRALTGDGKFLTAIRGADASHMCIAEFAPNNAISVSTGFSPFYLNAGIHPTLPTSLMVGTLPKTRNEAVQVTLERMKTTLTEAQTNLARAQKRIAIAMNPLR